jgi:hypothetical protein
VVGGRGGRGEAAQAGAEDVEEDRGVYGPAIGERLPQGEAAGGRGAAARDSESGREGTGRGGGGGSGEAGPVGWRVAKRVLKASDEEGHVEEEAREDDGAAG